MISKKISLAFLSAGLGNVSRGFETSASIWFQKINERDEFNVRLFSGGKHFGSTSIWNISRNGMLSSTLRKFHLINDGCRLEQITFSLGFLIYLFRYRPTFIWLQEGTLGSILSFYRKVFRFKYKILFCDGAPVGARFASKFDFLIFLHQYALDDAIAVGIDPKKCSIIPHLTLQPKETLEKKEARKVFNINEADFVIICVAAWNIHHKRIDYLLQEIGNLKNNNITLLLCGQPEPGSSLLMEMAVNLDLNVKWYTLSQDDLSVAYLASDLFVLPSMSEGLGAVLIEAANHSLFIIAHPHQGSKYILGEDYQGLVDISKKDSLSKAIKSLIINNTLVHDGEMTKNIVDEKFNNNKLVDLFINFVFFAANA